MRFNKHFMSSVLDTRSSVISQFGLFSSLTGRTRCIDNSSSWEFLPRGFMFQTLYNFFPPEVGLVLRILPRFPGLPKGQGKRTSRLIPGPLTPLLLYLEWQMFSSFNPFPRIKQSVYFPSGAGCIWNALPTSQPLVGLPSVARLEHRFEWSLADPGTRGTQTAWPGTPGPGGGAPRGRGGGLGGAG